MRNKTRLGMIGVAVVAAVMGAPAMAQSNIAAAHKFAWSENCGYVNFRDVRLRHRARAHSQRRARHTHCNSKVHCYSSRQRGSVRQSCRPPLNT